MLLKSVASMVIYIFFWSISEYWLKRCRLFVDGVDSMLLQLSFKSGFDALKDSPAEPNQTSLPRFHSRPDIDTVYLYCPCCCSNELKLKGMNVNSKSLLNFSGSR